MNKRFKFDGNTVEEIKAILVVDDIIAATIVILCQMLYAGHVRHRLLNQ